MFKKQTVFQASVIILITTFLSRIIGFVREIIIANIFGASVEYDTYLIAVTFPLIIYSISLYALPSGFIPLYVEEKITKNKESSNRFFLNFINVFSLIFFLLFLGLYFFSPHIIKLYFQSTDNLNIQYAVKVLKYVSIIVFFGGIFAILRSYLNANKHFILPAFAPLILNLVVIFFIYAFSENLSTFSIAIGLITGYFIQFFILFIYVFFRKTKYKFYINIKDSQLKKVFYILISIIILETIGQLYVVIDRAFNFLLPVGAISALNYANIIYLIPISIFGIAIGTAIFPTVSELVLNKNYDGLNKFCEKSIKTLVIISIPIVFLFLSYSREFVIVLFQRGEFDNYATKLTSESLVFLSIGLGFLVIHAILIKIFYALRNIKELFFTSILAIILKIIISMVLVKNYFHIGLALATSIAGFVNVVLMYGILSNKLNGLNHKSIISTFLKVIIICSISTFVLRFLIVIHINSSVLLNLIVQLLIWISIFIILVFLIRIKEIEDFFVKIKSKIR